MTNEEYESAVARADDFLDTLKDTCHDQYDKIKELKEENAKLRDKVECLEDKIGYAIEYIEKYLQEHIIDEYPDEQSTFYDEKDRFIPNAKEQLLDILKGE